MIGYRPTGTRSDQCGQIGEIYLISAAGWLRERLMKSCLDLFEQFTPPSPQSSVLTGPVRSYHQPSPVK